MIGLTGSTIEYPLTNRKRVATPRRVARNYAWQCSVRRLLVFVVLGTEYTARRTFRIESMPAKIKQSFRTEHVATDFSPHFLKLKWEEVKKKSILSTFFSSRGSPFFVAFESHLSRSVRVRRKDSLFGFNVDLG